jgi:hypothetical protein
MSSLEEVNKQVEIFKVMRQFFPKAKPTFNAVPNEEEKKKSKKQKANKAQNTQQKEGTSEEDISLAELRRKLEEKKKELKQKSHPEKKERAEGEEPARQRVNSK